MIDGAKTYQWVSSEQVLVWAQMVEAQRSQKAALANIRDAKDFD